MKVLIDNGHGINTRGKHSPDRRIYEWQYCRRVAEAVAKALQKEGIDAVRIVKEDTDVSLAERVRRVNAYARRDPCVLVSIHLNAAGSDGKWHDARGFLPFVSLNASAKSKRFAQILYDEAEQRNLKGNRWMGKDRYKVKDLAMCRETLCPAVLTENLFQDNIADVDYLLTDDGFNAIVGLHVAAIKRYVTTYG